MIAQQQRRVKRDAAPATWTPANNPTLYWWKADAGVSDTGGLVDSWTDQNVGVQLSAIGNQRPLTNNLTLSGFNVIEGDGNDDELRNAGGLTLPTTHAFTVICGHLNVGEVIVELFDSNNASSIGRVLFYRYTTSVLLCRDVNTFTRDATVTYPTVNSHLIIQGGITNGISNKISVNGGAFSENTIVRDPYTIDSLVVVDDSTKNNTISSFIAEIFFHQDNEFTEAYNYAVSRYGAPN